MAKEWKVTNRRTMETYIFYSEAEAKECSDRIADNGDCAHTVERERE